MKKIHILLVVVLQLFFFFLAPVSQALPRKGGEGDIYRDLELFAKALAHVENDYVEPPNNERLVFGAIQGMMSSLDPHSVFLSPAAYKEIKVDTQGWFGGIGIEITIKDNYLTVVTPIEGSPAERAGIRAGDRITKIDGTSIKGLSLFDTVQKMRGPRGSRMVLTILPKGSTTTREVTIQRDIVHIQSVRHQMMEPGYGYVKINSFQEGTTKEMEKAIRTLEKSSAQHGEKHLTGLILDLRNNPGGLLEEAVEMADKFLDKGIIVTTSSRGKEIDRHEAHAEGTYPFYPIVILVNGGSASASEIVAAALQENKRAVLMGSKTFGKGSVQTIFDLGRGSAIKLTIAKYFTPSGKSIQGQGISPDITTVKSEKKPDENTADEKAKPDPEIQQALGYLKKEVTPETRHN